MELSNRVLHVFGGGFLAFLICFLAALDSRVRIRRFQFFLFSFLIVIALGVANEILLLATFCSKKQDEMTSLAPLTHEARFSLNCED